MDANAGQVATSMFIQRTMLLILGSTITNRNEDSDLITIEIHCDLANPLMRTVSVTTTVLELLDDVLPDLPWSDMFSSLIKGLSNCSSSYYSIRTANNPKRL